MGRAEAKVDDEQKSRCKLKCLTSVLPPGGSRWNVFLLPTAAQTNLDGSHGLFFEEIKSAY